MQNAKCKKKTCIFLVEKQKFVRLVCADLAEAINVNLDSFLEIDDACGAGTLASLDLTYEEYLTTIEDAIALLHEEIDLSIPEEDIETYCEVCCTI